MAAFGEKIVILYFITSLKLGGAQSVLIYLLRCLDRQRFQPMLACLYGGDSFMAQQVRELGVPVVDLGMSSKWRLDALWRFYRLLRQEKPAILHASLFHANIPARLLGRLAGVPVILTWRQNIDIGGPRRDFINRMSARLDDGVVAVSKLTRQAEIQASRVPPGKVSLIYNCIDVDKFPAARPANWSEIRQSLGIPAEAFLIGMVGRLHPQKGIHHLLAAMPRILQSAPHARLLLVGDGELRAALEQQVNELQISQAVVFAGVRADVPDLLRTFDVFVLPSLWEGLPLAILEAMSAGLPVVATAVGGTPEAVLHGETGLLVPAGEPGALAEALLALQRQPELRAHLGQAGRQRVQEVFSAQGMARKLEALYEQLLKQKLMDKKNL